MAGHCEKVFEVVPVEHRGIMQLCGPLPQSCGSRSSLA
jgi:hypothetical protein